MYLNTIITSCRVCNLQPLVEPTKGNNSKGNNSQGSTKVRYNKYVIISKPFAYIIYITYTNYIGDVQLLRVITYKGDYLPCTNWELFPPPQLRIAPSVIQLIIEYVQTALVCVYISALLHRVYRILSIDKMRLLIRL